MKNIVQSRVASVLTLLLGAWLLMSPLFISISGGALVSLLVVGSVLVVSGAVQFFWENTFPSWITALTALYFFVSALSFDISTAALWNEVAGSVGALILAMWDGIEMGEVHRLHHHGIY